MSLLALAVPHGTSVPQFPESYLTSLGPHNFLSVRWRCKILYMLEDFVGLDILSESTLPILKHSSVNVS